MSLRSLAALAFSATVAVPAVAQDRSDLSGTWQAGARVMTISASDSTFDIATGRQSLSFPIGVSTRVGRGNSRGVARWAGTTMQIELNQGKRTFTRSFELVGADTLRMTDTRTGRPRVVDFNRQ